MINRKMSTPCGKSELLLFDAVPTQVCLTRGSWRDIHPLNSVGDGPIQFIVHGSDDRYIDLNDTILYIKVAVTGEAGVANLLLSSLFSDVQLSVGDKIVEGGDHMYPYKSYISTLLNYEKDVKKTQLSAAGFKKDSPKLFDSSENKAFAGRLRSNPMELMGALNLSFLMQSKYLLPGVDIRIRLNRSKSAFCLMKFDKVVPTIQITTAVLYVRQVSVLSSVLKAHEDGLSLNNAIYPYQRQSITNFTIAKGSVTESREILIGSELPKLIIVGMVDNAAFNGDLKKNPYNFQHFNLSYLALLKNGESLPGPPLQLDFANNTYLRAYMNLIQNLELFNKNESNAITVEDFVNGTSLFTFNLTPDLSFGGGCAQRYETSNLRLDMKFGTPLTTSINVLIYTLYDAQLEITKNREILLV